MAQSICNKCGATTFEAKEAPRMSGTDYSWGFVQCSSCGGVVGVVDFFPHALLIDRLDAISKHLGIS